MKKLFILLATALMSVMVSYAEQTVFIGETGYDSLEAAFSAAVSGDVITLTGDQTISKRVTLSGKSVTITADKDAGIKIIRANNYNNGMLLLVNSSGTLNIENITFDGNNISSSIQVLEIADKNDTMNLTDVNFVNCISTHNNGLFKMKGYAILNNVSIENCTVPEGRGYFLVGQDKHITLTGEGNYSLFIESSHTIAADNFTGKCPIILQTHGEKDVVMGGKLNNFTLANETDKYEFIEEEGNIKLVSIVPVIMNEATGQVYSSFKKATDACTEDENTLIITQDCDVTVRYMPTNNTTIKGKTGNEVLRSTFGNSLFLSVDGGRTLILEDLTLDCNFEGNNKSEIEAGTTGKLILRNVKIINSKTTNYLINIKGNSHGLDMTNVTIEDCTNNYVYLQDGATLNLSGNNNFAILCKNANQTINALEDGIDHTDIVYITYEDPSQLQEEQLVVSNCTHGTRFRITNRKPETDEPSNDEPAADEPASNYDEGVFLSPAKRNISTYADQAEDLYPLANQHYFLYSKDGQHLYLTTDKETRVSKVETVENGKVNVIDFAGRVIRRNVDSSTALTGLPSGMYIVGTRKVVVR